MAGSSDAATLIIVLEAQSQKLQNSLVATNKLINNFAAATERRFDQMNAKNAASFAKLEKQVGGSVGRITSIMATLGLGLSIQGVISYADAWKLASNKIAAASQISGLQARSLDELAAGATRARVAFGDYVNLYSRMLRIAPNVAASELQVARATDIITEAFKAGGANAQEQSNAIVQIGQALGSGFLQGQDLRSIRELAPVLAQQVANYFHTTIGGLKQLGKEGKITSEEFFKAILAGGSNVDKAFATTSSTIAEAITNVETAFTAYVGTAGQASGATQALIDSLNFLSQHFKDIAPVVVELATIIIGALTGQAIAGMVVGIGEAIGALGAFFAALGAAEGGMAALALAAGPIGLVIGAATAAIALLVYQQGEAARVAAIHTQAIDANKSALETATTGSQEFRDSLKRNIEVQLAAAKAAIAESEAQILANEARAAYATAFSGTPIVGGIASAVAGVSGMGANAAAGTLAENQKFVAQLQDELAQIDKIMKTKPGKYGSGNSGAGGSGKEDPYQKKKNSVIDATEALLAESAAQSKLNPLVNDYGYAVERAKTEQELLAAAQKAGLAITPALKDQIKFLADGYAEAGAAAKKLAEQQSETKKKMDDFFGGLKDVTSGWIQDLINGKTAAEALGDALSNVGNRLINLGLDTLFGNGQGASPYGALGQLFFHANGGIAAHGRPVAFANGGISNTAAVFGEAGPEAAVPLPDGRRIPVDLNMPNGSGGGGTHVSIPISIDASGADPAAIERLHQSLGQLKTELPSRVVAAVRDAKKRRAL